MSPTTTKKATRPDDPSATPDRLPGVLSFQRGTIVSDALFYNLMADGSCSPLHVVRHGIRGTQNVDRLESTEGSTSPSARRLEVVNIQATDSAKLDPQAQALRVTTSLRFIDIAQLLFACAPGKADAPDDIVRVRAAFESFVAKAKGDAVTGPSKGLREVARRYARNLANGRFLWRNRTVAQKVTVRVAHASKMIGSFDALSVPLNDFAGYGADEERVADVIVAGLRGDRDAHLRVTADVDFGLGGGIEVFPSQNYLENKPKGFARPLYCVGQAPVVDGEVVGIRTLGQAALRDQKVANALRTFDTWYPTYGQRGVAIPIEPNGASLDAQQFFRPGAASGFRLMLRLGTLDPDSADGMFMLACLIRGGVFSGAKEDKPKPEAPADQDQDAAEAQPS